VATVFPVRPSGRAPVLWPLIATAVMAEAGVRLLAPRRALLRPDPVDVESYFESEEIRRGAAFARPQLALGLTRSVIELAALATLVERGRGRRGAHRRRLRIPARRSVKQRLIDSSELRGAGAAAGLAGGMTLLGLPLSAIARRRAMAVGLVTQSWRGWAGDLVKQLAIESVLAGGAGAATTALTRRYPRSWWLPAAAGSVAVGTLLGALAPVLLDPVFNRFEPLAEGELRSDVLELARAAGVEVGEVYAVDASRRTTGANAYVTGLGPTKRVVLFDTLIERYNRDEIRVVVAHELAHVRHRDVLRGVAYGALVAPPAALAVQRLSWELSPHRGNGGAIPALALAAALVTAPTALIGNRLSRVLERRADEFSLELSGATDAFISFERAVALQNVADVTPPRWVRTLLATHPPTSERIGAALAFSRTGQGAQA
jgi:STE24 endopeptidase